MSSSSSVGSISDEESSSSSPPSKGEHRLFMGPLRVLAWLCALDSYGDTSWSFLIRAVIASLLANAGFILVAVEATMWLSHQHRFIAAAMITNCCMQFFAHCYLRYVMATERELFEWFYFSDARLSETSKGLRQAFFYILPQALTIPVFICTTWCIATMPNQGIESTLANKILCILAGVVSGVALIPFASVTWGAQSMLQNHIVRFLEDVREDETSAIVLMERYCVIAARLGEWNGFFGTLLFSLGLNAQICVCLCVYDYINSTDHEWLFIALPVIVVLFLCSLAPMVIVVNNRLENIKRVAIELSIHKQTFEQREAHQELIKYLERETIRQSSCGIPITLGTSIKFLYLFGALVAFVLQTERILRTSGVTVV